MAMLGRAVIHEGKEAPSGLDHVERTVPSAWDTELLVFVGEELHEA